MAFYTTLIGGSIGVGAQLYMNGLRKLPLMRHPWEHVLAFGIGAWGLTKLREAEVSLKERLDRMLEERGLPPVDRHS